MVRIEADRVVRKLMRKSYGSNHGSRDRKQLRCTWHVELMGPGELDITYEGEADDSSQCLSGMLA